MMLDLGQFPLVRVLPINTTQLAPGRNRLFPCGSNRKYKQCCMGSVSKEHSSIVDEIQQMLAMSPGLDIEDLNVVLQQRMQERNNSPHPEDIVHQRSDWKT